MKILFMGSGPSTEVKGAGRNKRTNSSLLISHRNEIILIDCTPNFKEQVEREKIDRIDYLMLSHGHSDVIGGIIQLKEFLDKEMEEETTIPCYCSRQTWKIVQSKFKQLDHLEFNEINQDKQFKINDIKFTPFKVVHYEGFPSDGSKFPCFGFRIED